MLLVLRNLTFTVVVVMVALVIPFFVRGDQTVSTLADLATFVGPTFWPLLTTLCLTIAGCWIAMSRVRSDPLAALVSAEQALDIASIALWCGFIGTYWSLTRAMLTASVTDQLVGEAMGSTMIGAVAIAAAGTVLWLVRLLCGRSPSCE